MGIQINSFLSSLGNIGIHKELTFSDAQLVRLSNYVAAGSIIICFIGGILYLYQYIVYPNNIAGLVQASISTLQILAIIFVIYLNKLHKYLLARYLLLISYTLNISTIGLLFQQESGYNFYFLLAPFGILILLGLNITSYILIFFVLLITLGIIYYQNHFDAILPMPTTFLSHNYIVTYTLVCLLIILMLYLLIRSNKDMEKKLTTAMETDYLTGLYNRRKYDNFSKLAYLNAMRNREPISLLLFDLDHFKLYNDYYGHLAGDNCLIKFSKILQNCIKDDYTFLARFGGEEFIVILSNTSIDNAVQIAKNITKALEDLAIEHQTSPISPIVTCSCGIASSIPKENDNYSSLFVHADRNLYKAKTQGRNQIIY